MRSPSPITSCIVNESDVLKRLSRARWRKALALTTVMLVVYFGFILLTGLSKTLMTKQITEGLSVGILLGAIVIVLAFSLTGAYVHWANAHYDPELHAVRQSLKAKANADGRAS